MRAVAQQAQCDVHADLRAPAGEQRALAGEVGAGIALRVTHGGAVGAQLVIERVDDRVRLLADVAGARLDEGASGRRGGGGADRDAASLVVDAVGCTGGGGGDHAAVGVGDDGALLEPALLLHGLEHLRRRAANHDEVGVLLIDLGHLREHLEHHVQVGGVDAAGFGAAGV